MSSHPLRQAPRNDIGESAEAVIGYPVSLHGIGKTFSTQSGQAIRAIESIDLEIAAGDFVVIVGPSGCGKSTLLNCIAGLEKTEIGHVNVNGRQMSGQINSDIGYMFQQDTLFPWYTVEKNVALGLRYAGTKNNPESRERVDHLLEMADLSSVRHAYPSELSGGMRRRVALCATLAIQPRVLLMDEPFGALDTFTKASIQQYLLKLWESLRPTVIFITHDLEEAVTLADRVVVLSRRPARIKEIIDVGIQRPRDVYAIKDTPEFLTDYRQTWRALGGEFDY